MPAARTRLEVAAGRGLTRFVARDIELQQLRRVQQIAGQGHGQVVGIVGEAGVGKSRLVREFLHSQPTADWLVMEARNALFADHRAAQGLFQDQRPRQYAIHP